MSHETRKRSTEQKTRYVQLISQSRAWKRKDGFAERRCCIKTIELFFQHIELRDIPKPRKIWDIWMIWCRWFRAKITRDNSEVYFWSYNFNTKTIFITNYRGKNGITDKNWNKEKRKTKSDTFYLLWQIGQHSPSGVVGYLQVTGAQGIFLHSISPWMQEHCWQPFVQVAPSSWTVPFTLQDFWHSHSSTLLILPSAAASWKEGCLWAKTNCFVYFMNITIFLCIKSGGCP